MPRLQRRSVEMLDDNSGEVVPAAGVKIQIAKWKAEHRDFYRRGFHRR